MTDRENWPPAHRLFFPFLALRAGISKIIDKVAGGGKDKGKDAASNWFIVQINNLKNSSTTKQTVVGASAGLITGYATGKLGRTVGYMVGGTILLVNVSGLPAGGPNFSSGLMRLIADLLLSISRLHTALATSKSTGTR